MSRDVLIQKTLDNLTKLPDQKVREVSDFTEFLINKIEDKLITEGIQKLTSDSKSFQFLESEEELYSKADLKEIYKWLKGDIVLIPFPFTDLTGVKNRPALILVESDADITVSFITTQVKWQEDSDIRIEPAQENGLKKPSLIRLGKLATIDKDLVIGRLGRVTTQEIKAVDENLIKLLKLV